MWGKKTKELETEIEKLRKLIDKNDDQYRLQLKSRDEAYDLLSKKFNEAADAENRLKKEYDKEKALAYKTMELEFKGKLIEDTQKIRVEADEKLKKGIEENFSQLKEQLAKLHSEGNAQTKFTEQIALKMMSVIKPSVPVIEQKDVDTASV